MRVIDEKEKIYNSFVSNSNDVKKDITYINSQYPQKKTIDYFSLLGGLLAIVFFVLIAVNPLFAIGGGLFLIFTVCYRLFYCNKKRIKFLTSYSESIAKNGKVKFNDPHVVSTIYPLYVVCDNEKEVFKLEYQNKDIMFMEYDDILSYEVKNPLEIEIVFNNKKRANVIFNSISKFKTNFNDNYQVEENKKTIEAIKNILDSIINKNVA